MKIHILDVADYSKKAIETYQKLGDITVGSTPVADTEILVLRLQKCDEKMIDSLPCLRAIAFNTTGQDHVDTEHARKKGIEIFSLKGDSFTKNVPASSEHAFGLMLALARDYKHAFQFPNSREPRSAYRGHDLQDKTLGIIGYGRIGRKVYHMAYAFGMNIIHYDIGQSDQAREDVIRNADFLLLSLTLDDNSRDSFTKNDFKFMKNTAYLINVSRGEIIQEDTLLDALQSGDIAGAGIDVTRDGDREELTDYARRNDNIILTNHIAGCTHESSHMTEEGTADKVYNFFKDEASMLV